MYNYSRRRTRKFLYQLLYAQSFWPVNQKELKETFFSWKFHSELDEVYLKFMFDTILEKEKFLISILEMYAPKFDINTMELSFIIPVFIWLTELLFFPEEIPERVVLNESVEIAKMYGDDSSKKMVNGVLHNTIKNLEEVKKLSENYVAWEIKNTLFYKINIS